jgi:hypothetical protein
VNLTGWRYSRTTKTDFWICSRSPIEWELTSCCGRFAGRHPSIEGGRIDSDDGASLLPPHNRNLLRGRGARFGGGSSERCRASPGRPESDRLPQ